MTIYFFAAELECMLFRINFKVMEHFGFIELSPLSGTLVIWLLLSVSGLLALYFTSYTHWSSKLLRFIGSDGCMLQISAQLAHTAYADISANSRNEETDFVFQK